MSLRKLLLGLLTRKRSCGGDRQRHACVDFVPVNDVLRLQLLRATLLSPRGERR